MDDSFIVWKLVPPKFRRSVKSCFALYRSNHVKKTKRSTEKDIIYVYDNDKKARDYWA